MKVLLLLALVPRLLLEVKCLSTNVLLVMKNGAHNNILDIWNTVGGLRDFDGSGSALPVNQLLSRVTFRSADVDILHLIVLNKIILQLLDSQGNVIWSVDFAPSLTNYMIIDLTTLTRQDDIVMSDFNPETVRIDWTLLYHQLAILPSNSSTDVYFSIWDDPTSSIYPMFLFPKSSNESEQLQTETAGVYTYVGCYLNLHIEMTIVIQDAALMNLDLCAEACSPSSVQFFAIEYNTRCFCGGFASSYQDMGIAFCNTYTCAGTTDLCGGPMGYFAVYEMLIEPVPATVPTFPQPILRMTFPYKHTLGKLVDIGQQASLPFYMTSIKLEFPLLLHFSYTVQYKQKYPCIYAERKQVIDILQSTERVFVGLILESVGIIEVTCIWIESELILHQTGQIVLERIDPDVTFISAPYLAVVGLWPETETTTALATSTETSLGPETTNAVKTTETTNGSTEETTEDTSTAMSDQSTATEPVTTDQSMSSMESSTVSYDQTSTSRTSTMVSGQTNVSRSTCFCRCTNFSNMTREELLRRKEALRRELGVNVTQLSSYIRKFISVPDNRPSAAGVGAVGVMILALVICTIIILDLTTLRKRKK